jgi:hypothetical protein
MSASLLLQFQPAQFCLSELEIPRIPSHTESQTPSEAAELVELAAAALCRTGYPALRAVEIEIQNGVAILWGRVPTYYQKQLAQTVLQTVAGVRQVANGLEVFCCRPDTTRRDSD